MFQENGDFNGGLENFQVECFKNTGVEKKTKGSWAYIRENGVDSLYLFRHRCSSTVARLSHPEGEKCLKFF